MKTQRKTKLQHRTNDRQKVSEASLFASLKAMVTAHADLKEKEYDKAKELSPNLNEAVEKSLAKSSADETTSSAR